MKKHRLILLTIALAISCTGCGQSNGSAAKKACKAFFTAYENSDSMETAAYFGDLYTAAAFSELQCALAAKTHTEVKKASTTDNMVQVAVTVETIDVPAVISALPDTVTSTELAEEALLSAFQANDVPLRTFDVTALMVQENGTWTIQMTPELSNALLGGFQEMLDDLSNNISEVAE